MENFYQIFYSENPKFRVFLNFSNSELLKKYHEINRNKSTLKKFVLVVEAVKLNSANKTQYNWEGSCHLGQIYAIKVDQHRFYTIQANNEGYRDLYVCRYGKKQSQKNDKQLTTIINSIENIEIQKIEL